MNARVQSDSSGLTSWFMIIGLAGTFIGLFLSITYLLVTALIMVALGVLPRVYLKTINRHFLLYNEREKLYLSVGNEGGLQFRFANKGLLPILFCDIQFTFEKHVQVPQIPSINGKQYKIRVGIGSRETRLIKIPVVAKSRGMARMGSVAVKIYDPFRLASLTYTLNYARKEIVVFPNPKAVGGMEQLLLPIEGQNANQKSLFQDVTAPIGTRDYIPTDPLKSIHWKASARMGALQTKLYERTMGMTWSIIILLDREITKTAKEQLETQLSYIATLCGLAQRQGVNMELFINIKPMSQAYVTHLELSHDRAQYIKAMEFLALIQVNKTKTHPIYALGEIDRHYRSQRVIMIVDHSTIEEKQKYYNKWMRYGHHLYNIEPEGYLLPMNVKGKRGERLA